MGAISNQHEWNWPDELDALTAAPQYHILIFENKLVRVLDTKIPPGHIVPLHTHRWPGVLYILSWSDFVRRDGEGKTVAESRGLGTGPEASAIWSAPLPPHSIENVGESEIRVVGIELKNPQ